MLRVHLVGHEDVPFVMVPHGPPRQHTTNQVKHDHLLADLNHVTRKVCSVLWNVGELDPRPQDPTAVLTGAEELRLAFTASTEPGAISTPVSADEFRQANQYAEPTPKHMPLRTLDVWMWNVPRITIPKGQILTIWIFLNGHVDRFLGRRLRILSRLNEFNEIVAYVASVLAPLNTQGGPLDITYTRGASLNAGDPHPDKFSAGMNANPTDIGCTAWECNVCCTVDAKHTLEGEPEHVFDLEPLQDIAVVSDAGLFDAQIIRIPRGGTVGTNIGEALQTRLKQNPATITLADIHLEIVRPHGTGPYRSYRARFTRSLEVELFINGFPKITTQDATFGALALDVSGKFFTFKCGAPHKTLAEMEHVDPKAQVGSICKAGRNPRELVFVKVNAPFVDATHF